MRLAEEAEAEAEALRISQEAADSSSSGGSIAAIIIVLLLLIGGAVWFYFSDKACFCLKDKIRTCKTKSKSFLKQKA